VPHEALDHDRHVAVRFIGGRRDFPLHLRRDFGDAPVDLAVEQLDELRPPLRPPVLRRLHGLAVVEHQRVRELRVGVGLRFVVVGEVGRLRVRPIAAGPQLFDAEQVEHLLPVFLRGLLLGLLRGLLLRRQRSATARLRRGDGGEREDE
jgi:hypothetical protein